MNNYLILVEHKDSKKFRRSAEVVNKLCDRVAYNKDYYIDMIKFNLCHRPGAVKSTRLSAGALPAEAQGIVNEGYKKFNDIDDAFGELNIPRTMFGSTTPLECKYVFEYKKKYGHLEEGEELTVDELLVPLNTADAKMFEKMF
jgi:hypothetical protein